MHEAANLQGGDTRTSDAAGLLNPTAPIEKSADGLRAGRSHLF